MKKVDVNWIRENFDVPDDMMDDQILKAGERIEKEREAALEKMIGNQIELNRMKVQVLGEGIEFVAGYHDTHMLNIVEWLFVEGYYGACCILSRATLEYLLQEECVRSPEFKGIIDGPGRNPEIGEMAKYLGGADSWNAAHWQSYEKVKENGDIVAHHRLERICQGKDPKSYKWGVAVVKFGVGGLENLGPDRRATYEANRANEERRMSMQSLAALYVLFKMYRGSPSTR